MRTNGYIQIQEILSGEVNQYGETIPSAVSWGNPIDCQIELIYDTQNAEYEDGHYRGASCSILFERPIPKAAKVIRVVRYGDTIGEFHIRSRKPIPNMSRFQITV